MNPGGIVCDTGPVLHLHEAGALTLLRWTGLVHIPPAVDLELRRLISQWTEERPAWIQVIGLEHGFFEQATQWQKAGFLHTGESEALALALQLQARWMLTDDTSARVLAKSLGVEAHGSLGVVLWAASHHHITQQQSVNHLEALFRSSLWVSASVRQEARETLKRIHVTS